MLVRSRCDLLSDQFLQQADKILAADHPGAETFEVCGMHLAVDQFHPLINKLTGIADEGIFAGIALFAEHTLAEKYGAETYTVQAAHQFAVEPGFGAMGIARFVQTDIGLFYIIGDPGAVLPFARDRFALGDHFGESLVDSEIESILFEKLLHALAHFQFPGKKDKTGIGAPPQDIFAFVPGEDTVTVGEEQAFEGEVAAYGEQSVRFGQMCGREVQVLVESEKWHRISYYAGTASMVAPIPLSVMASHWGFRSS